MNEVKEIQHDAEQGCERRRKTDHRQAGILPKAHQKRERKPDKEGLQKPLRHGPHRFLMSVVISDQAKQYRSHDGLRRKSPEVGRAARDDRLVSGKYRGEPPAEEEYDAAHGKSDHKTDADRGFCPPHRSVLLPGANIHGDKSCHGLHQGTRQQHGKINDFAGDSVAGGCLEIQPVDESTDDYKGDLREKIHESHRDAYPQNSPRFLVEAEVLPVNVKSCVLLSEHDKGADHADRLRQHGRNRCPGDIQMEARD